MKYSVIVPTYNRIDLVKSCLESIITHTPAQIQKEEIEVIVVCNGCTDGTEEYVKQLNQQISNKNIFKTVYWDRPLGYAKAVNLGIAVSTGEYLILLNNDACIVDFGWIDILEEPFKKFKNVGITGPTGVDRSNIPWLVFFCVMIKRELISVVGYLSEEYGTGGGEDTEYCIKAYMSGYTNYMVPLMSGNVRSLNRTRLFPIYHAGGVTTKKLPEYEETNKRNEEKLTALFGPP